MIESHKQVRKKRFVQDCAALIARLYAGVLKLPDGRRDDDISERQRKIHDAISIDVHKLIPEMVQKTHRRGPWPKPWHPLARKWRWAASRNLDRVDPAIRADPLFDTVVPFEAWERMCRALHAYLGDIDCYWMVFNPYHREEAYRNSLSDDLSDIWRDLKMGLLLYAKGSERARQHAIWMWKFHAHCHWGHDAVLALNALQWIVSDAYNDQP